MKTQPKKLMTLFEDFVITCVLSAPFFFAMWLVSIPPPETPHIWVPREVHQDYNKWENDLWNANERIHTLETILAEETLDVTKLKDELAENEKILAQGESILDTIDTYVNGERKRRDIGLRYTVKYE